jgi:hypothetical protein
MRLLSLLVLSVSRSRLAVAAVLVAVAFWSACDKVPLLAPTESTIVLNVNSTTVPVNGTAQVIASVTESAGTPVQNGTVVTFTSSLGTIDPVEGRTQGGKATVTFRAGQQSGTATIGAFSGAARSETVEILVGGAAAGAVVVRSEPRGVGLIDIVATVLDESGNALPGVPVTFSTTAGSLNPGQSVTGPTGEARTTLSTSRDATVTARAGQQTATIEVTAAGPSVTLTVPTTIEAGIPAAFTIAPPTGTILSEVSINWGDGTAPTRLTGVTGQTAVSHAFPRAGVYTVTVTSTDFQGTTGTTQAVVNVTEPAGISLTLSATPNPATVGAVVTFTASTGGLGTGGPGIASYTWDFGDGTGAVTTGGTTTHVYGGANTYNASVVARSTTGTEGRNQVSVRVQ